MLEKGKEVLLRLEWGIRGVEGVKGGCGGKDHLQPSSCPLGHQVDQHSLSLYSVAGLILLKVYLGLVWRASGFYCVERPLGSMHPPRNAPAPHLPAQASSTEISE